VTLLDVQDLQVEYRKPGSFGRAVTRAVDRVDLVIHPGEIVAVVGESGSRKTTVARSIAGLVRPSAGTMSFAGEQLGRRHMRGGRPVIQMIFQDPRSSLNPRRTAAQSIVEGWRGSGVGTLPSASDIESVLVSVGLDPTVAERYPAQLSGGQCQRVSIARALAAQPELLICDEAVSALDVTVQAQILSLLRQVRDQTGVAMLFITHDLGVVRQLADRVYVMSKGTIVEHGSVSQVLESPRDPYTQQLLEAALDIPEA
jgi:ABC-type glutathione transport system ATPase component